MAKVIIVGDAVVIKSAWRLEDIQALEKYRPKALCLYETDEGGKKEEIFKVGSTSGRGSISKYGASFSSATHDEEKLATITMEIPKDVDDAKFYVAEFLGSAILNLNMVEDQLAEALAGVEVEKNAVLENITIQ